MLLLSYVVRDIVYVRGDFDSAKLIVHMYADMSRVPCRKRDGFVLCWMYMCVVR